MEPLNQVDQSWVDAALEGSCTMVEIEDIPLQRHMTHGPFARNALISQELKQHLTSFGSSTLCHAQREVLDMICLKLSRILSGQAMFHDHWDDIAGYAKLGSEACDAVKDNPEHIKAELAKVHD